MQKHYHYYDQFDIEELNDIDEDELAEKEYSQEVKDNIDYYLKGDTA